MGVSNKWWKLASLLLYVLVFSEINQALAAEDHCIWYGECGDSSTTYQRLNCEYHGPAKWITNASHIAILEDLCPGYVDESGRALTCCDGNQLETFRDGTIILARQILQICPSCWYNFRRYFCAMTCSPHQSRYLKATEYVPATDEGKTDLRMVNRVAMNVDETYTEELHKSCVSISMGSMKALDMMCGANNHLTCSPKIWFTYLAKNEYTPFITDLTFGTEPIVVNGTTLQPLKEDAIPCSQGVGPFGSACSCTHCSEMCNFEPYEIPDRTSGHFKIGVFDGMEFIAGTVFVLLSSSFLAYILLPLFFPGVWKKDHGKHGNSAGRMMKRDHSMRMNTKASKESLPLHENGATSDGKEGSAPQNSDDMQMENSNSQPDAKVVIISTNTCYQNFSITFEETVEKFFYRLGHYCAAKPFTVLGIGLLFSSTLSLGILFFSVVTDPLELWAMPNSRARLEREYYDSTFQPFYRIQHVIITPKNPEPLEYKGMQMGSVFQYEILKEAFELHKKIVSVTGKIENQTVHLEDVCFMPMAPDTNKCAVMSLFSHKMIDEKPIWLDVNNTHLDYLLGCFESPTSLPCLGNYGGPLFPYVTLGGFSEKNYSQANALVITVLVNNYYDKAKTVNALAWEEELIKLLKNYSSPLINVYFKAERSIEDEFDRESHSDISTILISYLIMFCYISVTLGQANNCQRLFIDSKITLGIGGIALVILSVMSSVGIFGFCGIPATLIVVEVVPFMCLAVGVDNIFILVQAYQRDERQPNEPRENQIGRIVSQVAPSMFLSSITDACGFYLGALSSMPAVQTFGYYAGTALLIALLLQITCFVSLLSLDCRRQESGRIDVCCWIQTVKSGPTSPNEGLLYRIFKNVYAPFLMQTPVRVSVILVFLAWVCSSIAVINKIEIGLDPELPMPRDSYMLDYFAAIKEYLAVGPPMFFVIKNGYNYSSLHAQNKICNGPLCAQDSLLSRINYATRFPEKTYIAENAFGWVDDYNTWITNGLCCKQDRNGNFCPSTQRDCNNCPLEVKEVDGVKRVVGANFTKFLPFYLRDVPSPDGCIGGHAAYGNSVELLKNGTQIGSTSFMTYHTILKTSKDYYEALWWARYLSDKLTEKLNEDPLNQRKEGEPKYEVFPYSIFYVFYEQYLTIWQDTMCNLLYSSLTIFVMAFFLLGLRIHLAIIISLTVSMIVINLMGVMYWWNIQLNAVSLVNLVVSIGIAVEFCSHITRDFGVSTKETKILRTQEALTEMGSSVLCGITFTKFGGILVLYFAKSLIFQIFYFRINLCIVLFGAAHGLIFLPCLLSFFGPSVNKRKTNEQQQALLDAPYRADESESTS